MLCCVGPWKDPASAYNDQAANDVSPYPGQGQFVKTGGNALAAAPASNDATSESQAVKVVIPQNMTAGQKIQVVTPDGSRTVTATIPEGMSPGESFVISFPSPLVGSNTTGRSAKKESTTETTTTDSTTTTPVAKPINPPVSISTVPFSQVLDNPPRTMPSQRTPSHNDAKGSNQKLLLVQVPPGTVAGSTLYVKVPGENRTLAAKVPAGCSQFHVSYEPRPGGFGQSVAHDTSQRPMPVPTNDNGQKLILVRVPPGTAPGSTLHVEVPDEPGRILAAQVPPNVSEFQVAYQPRNVTIQNRTQPQTGYNMRANQGYGGMMNNALVPMIGGAAMGAAGMAMYDHYHHDPYYGSGYADAGAYDYNDIDYGGADYDGDYGFDGGF